MNMALSSAFKQIGKEILTFFYFPIWWYSKGVIRWYALWYGGVIFIFKRSGVSVWIKNWLVPMFGQSDWQGRLISFVMRTIQIIIRFFALLIFSIFYTIIMLAILCGPLYAIYVIIFSL